MHLLSDGKRVVSGSPDSTISLLDIYIKPGKVLASKKEHSGTVHNVGLTKDEKILMSSGSESEILLWDFKHQWLCFTVWIQTMKAFPTRDAPDASPFPSIKCLWPAMYTVARESSTSNFHRCHVSLNEITNGTDQVIKISPNYKTDSLLLRFIRYQQVAADFLDKSLEEVDLALVCLK